MIKLLQKITAIIMLCNVCIILYLNNNRLILGIQSYLSNVMYTVYNTILVYAGKNDAIFYLL